VAHWDLLIAAVTLVSCIGTSIFVAGHTVDDERVTLRTADVDFPSGPMGAIKSFSHGVQGGVSRGLGHDFLADEITIHSPLLAYSFSTIDRAD
jgi:hypothetical protein